MEQRRRDEWRDRVVTRGQILEVVRGSQRLRVLVVSNDQVNASDVVAPWGLMVDRTGRAAAFQVVLESPDPLPGAVVRVPSVVVIDRTAIRANFGLVHPSTMRAVDASLREFLDL